MILSVQQVKVFHFSPKPLRDLLQVNSLTILKQMIIFSKHHSTEIAFPATFYRLLIRMVRLFFSHWTWRQHLIPLSIVCCYRGWKIVMECLQLSQNGSSHTCLSERNLLSSMIMSLSPLLLMMVYDIIKSRLGVECMVYADDTQLYMVINASDKDLAT